MPRSVKSPAATKNNDVTPFGTTLERLDAGQRLLQEQHDKVRGLIQKFKVLGKTKDLDEELRAIVEDAVDRCASFSDMIRDYLKEYDTERARLLKAIADLQLEDAASLRQAFHEFIRSDMTVTEKNVHILLYDYNELIVSFERLYDTCKGE